jgi:hypothetical protein
MLRRSPLRKRRDLPARFAATSVLRAVVSPLIYAKYRDGLPTRLTSATPFDEPHGIFPGPDPDRILVIGGISGAAVGVSSYKLGVACTSAETLSRLSGRGTEWSSMAVPIVRSGMSTRYLAGLPDLHRFDALVFFPGVSGALSLASPRKWARDLDRTLTYLSVGSAADATIIVANIAHIEDRVQGPTFIRSLVRQHTIVLNAVTARVVAAHPQAMTILMPVIDRRMVVNDVFSYTRLFRIWGVHLGRFIAAARGYPVPDDGPETSMAGTSLADDALADDALADDALADEES